MTTGPESCLTTGIGSLPFHNIDLALDFSFRMDIPFLPQIPLRNPWEYMIAQALEGLPGLEVARDGSACLDMNVWTARASSLDRKLEKAFTSPEPSDAFQAFEPSSPTSSSWEPFLWELAEHRSQQAKFQIAGPLTCQWALQTKGAKPAGEHLGVATQIYRLVLARALGMCLQLRSRNVDPIVFLDEPALYGLDPTIPKHLLGLQEIKLMVQALKKSGAQVGLHCCSDTHWESVMNLGLDWISLDTRLSLSHLIKDHATSLLNFIREGGRLALGLVPTSTPVEELLKTTGRDLAQSLLTQLRSLPLPDHELRDLVRSSLITPACGLALLSPEHAEAVFALLTESAVQLRGDRMPGPALYSNA